MEGFVPKSGSADFKKVIAAWIYGAEFGHQIPQCCPDQSSFSRVISYHLYITSVGRKFAPVEGLSHDLVCTGSIYHVHFAWQVWHGQLSHRFKFNKLKSFSGVEIDQNHVDKRILGGKGFAVGRLKRHNFCPASVYIYIPALLVPIIYIIILISIRHTPFFNQPLSWRTFCCSILWSSHRVRCPDLIPRWQKNS